MPEGNIGRVEREQREAREQQRRRRRVVVNPTTGALPPVRRSPDTVDAAAVARRRRNMRTLPRTSGDAPMSRAERRAVDRQIAKDRTRHERKRDYGKKLLRDLVVGKISRKELDRRFDRLGLDPDELSEGSLISAVEKTAESVGVGELAKLLPGGKPARDISPGWAAVEAASVLPVGRGIRLGVTGTKKAASAGKALLPERATRAPRTLQLGDKAQQLPRARSRVTQRALERPADWASRKLMDEGRVARTARRVLPTASAEARVAKHAGREQVIEAGRSQARMALHTRRLPKEGSSEDVAHFWWSQLPKSHRNAQGLALVREKQAAELGELTSGRALEGIKRQQGAVRAKLAQAADAEKFPLMGELEDLKVLASDVPNRIDDLARSLVQLERVIAKPPKLDERVIDSVRALSGDRRAILEGAGVLDPERAAAREGIVSGWLGLERSGDEAFVGHRLGKPRGAQSSLMPVSVGTGRVRLPEGVARENKLVLAKSGRVRASTQVAAQDWQAAQTYRQATRARSDLAQMGRPFTGRVPEDHVLVNPKGRALPREWKTDKLPKIPEGDEEAIREAAEGIVKSFMAEGDDVSRMLEEAVQAGVKWDELRVVPKSVVNRYYGQFLPTRSTKGGRALDTATDFMAASIVFARVGYIPKNVAQNLIMSIPHQGAFALVNIPRAAAAMADPELRALLGAEVGFSGPTQGLAREFSQKARGIPSKVANVVGGVADTPLRSSAFLHEAAAAGVISKLSPVLTAADKAKLKALLTDERYRPLLNDIRSRSVEAMADFSRLTPQQRKWARRFLIVPGWLAAGSRYPFHFAATHPGRSAAIGYAAAGEPYADELGLPQNPPVTEAFAEGLPWWAEGIGGEEGKVLRTTSLNPISTPWEIAGALAARDPRTALDYANPLIGAASNVAGRRVPYPGGTYQAGYGKSLQKNLERLAPNVTFARDIVEGSGSETYPEDESRWGRVKRELGVVPIEIKREMTPEARVRQEARELLSSLPPAERRDPEIRQVVTRSYRRKGAVDAARSEARKEAPDGGDPYQREALRREIEILAAWGEATSEDVTGVLAIVESGSPEEVKAVREELQQAFDELYLEPIREVRESAS